MARSHHPSRPDDYTIATNRYQGYAPVPRQHRDDGEPLTGVSGNLVRITLDHSGHVPEETASRRRPRNVTSPCGVTVQEQGDARPYCLKTPWQLGESAAVRRQHVGRPSIFTHTSPGHPAPRCGRGRGVHGVLCTGHRTSGRTSGRCRVPVSGWDLRQPSLRKQKDRALDAGPRKMH
jgi:hypothetical protein